MTNQKPTRKATTMTNEFVDTLCASTSKQIDSLKKLIFNTPDINHAKIEFLKQEIDTGRYFMDSQRIAEKLVELHQVSYQEAAELA